MTISRCARCHRVLTDPYSVAVGVGPECRGKYPKHHFPRPKWTVKAGRVTFDGLMVNSTQEKRDDNVETETEEG